MRIYVFGIFLLLVVMITAERQFKDKLSFAVCMKTCEKVVTECMKVKDSACNNAFVHCLTAPNFITCIGSANGLKMQEISRCMEQSC